MTEGGAGKFYVDVISAGGNYFLPIERAKLVGRYESPERAFYPEVHKERHGYWTSYSYTLAVMAYNTALVSASEAPKQYEDFLDTRWKGNVAIDADPDRAVMGLLKSWGDKKTEEFLEGLVKNNVVIRRGHTLITQLLCAGEFKAAIELLDYRVAEFKHKGCPVEMVFPNPTIGAPVLLYAARHAPHPYGASLLVDHMLSETGQRILAEKGRYTGRPGMKVKYPE
ncbi:MAG: ABC transporter substrate-binding protein, partial [Candidatus Binatia bacterium]